MILTIQHDTVYRYSETVRHSTQYLRLTPSDGRGQKILDWHLDLPGPATQGCDAYGNILHVLTLDFPHQEIRIRALGVVETNDNDEGPVDLPPLLFLRATSLTEADARLAAFANSFRDIVGSREGLDALSTAILAAMPFRPGITHAGSTAAEAFAAGYGVCQDHTHVFIACCRHLGLPARYISGYVYSPAHGDNHIASHAWAEVYHAGHWLSVDIVNQCHAGSSHLRLALGADYLDACPIRGVRRGGGIEALDTAAYVLQAQQQQQ